MKSIKFFAFLLIFGLVLGLNSCTEEKADGDVTEGDETTETDGEDEADKGDMAGDFDKEDLIGFMNDAKALFRSDEFKMSLVETIKEYSADPSKAAEIQSAFPKLMEERMKELGAKYGLNSEADFDKAMDSFKDDPEVKAMESEFQAEMQKIGMELMMDPQVLEALPENLRKQFEMAAEAMKGMSEKTEEAVEAE